MFVGLAGDRCEALLSSPSSTPLQHLRCLALLLGILVHVAGWTADHLRSGAASAETLSSTALWLFDGATVVVEATHGVIKYGAWGREQESEQEQEQNGAQQKGVHSRVESSEAEWSAAQRSGATVRAGYLRLGWLASCGVSGGLALPAATHPWGAAAPKGACGSLLPHAGSCRMAGGLFTCSRAPPALPLPCAGVHALERWRSLRAERRGEDGGGPWEWQGSFLYHLELGADLLLQSLTLAHYVHLWVVHGEQAGKAGRQAWQAGRGRAGRGLGLWFALLFDCASDESLGLGGARGRLYCTALPPLPMSCALGCAASQGSSSSWWSSFSSWTAATWRSPCGADCARTAGRPAPPAGSCPPALPAGRQPSCRKGIHHASLHAVLEQAAQCSVSLLSAACCPPPLPCRYCRLTQLVKHSFPDASPEQLEGQECAICMERMSAAKVCHAAGVSCSERGEAGWCAK